MFVAKQQMTPLSPRREILCNQTNFDCIRRLRRRTLRCTLHYASKLARSRCKANALFLRSRLRVCLFTEFKRVVRRVLDRGAKRRACISQAPAIVFCISNILENYVYLCYNNFILNFAKEILSNE